MPKSAKRLKTLRPKRGDLVINFRNSNDGDRRMVSIAYFKFFSSSGAFFRSVEDESIAIHQPQANSTAIIPDIRLETSTGLEAKTDGIFYLAKPGDTKTPYKVLIDHGFESEADILAEYNPNKISPP